VYGGVVIRATVPVHGKTSAIFHDGETILKDLPSPFIGGRYHSLMVSAETLPDSLEVSARSESGEIMGVRSRKDVVEGIQFHPESILTDGGHKILANFLNLPKPCGKE
jgi:para-aminobenzoate synthetase component 2